MVEQRLCNQLAGWEARQIGQRHDITHVRPSQAMLLTWRHWNNRGTLRCCIRRRHLFLPSIVTASAGVMAAFSNQSKADGCASAHSAAPANSGGAGRTRRQHWRQEGPRQAGIHGCSVLRASAARLLGLPRTNTGNRLTMALARRVMLASRPPPGCPPLLLGAAAAAAAATGEACSHGCGCTPSCGFRPFERW